MTKTNKQRVIDRTLDVSLWDLFDGEDFFDVRAKLDKLEAGIQYGNGEEAKFRIEPYGYDGGVELCLDVFRDETDAEYEKRMEKDAKAREKARALREKKLAMARAVLMETEEAERAEFLRLKAKFEQS